MNSRGIIVVASYLAAQMMGDVASLKIIVVAGWSMDAGTLIYPFTFTLRDLVHKTLGLQAARTLIVTAAAINVVMAFFFWIVSLIPGDPLVGPQEAFAAVLSPVWRIVAASIIAEIVAELLDTEVYRIWIKRNGLRRPWMRVIASNGVSTPVDSLIFSWIAFGGVFSSVVVWGIVVSNILLKYLVTVVSVPMIYFVPEKESA
jgi:uncharacterized integral membrane protein (TIGR00697 family)